MLLFLFQIPNKIGKFDFYFSFEHILNMCWIRFFYLPIFSIGFIKIMEKNNVKLWNPPNLQCSDIFNEYISHSKLGHFLYFSLRFLFAIFLVLWIIQAKSVWSTFFLSRSFRISAETFQERHQCNQNLLFFFENVWIYKVAGGKMMMTFFLATLVVFFCVLSLCLFLFLAHTG